MQFFLDKLEANPADPVFAHFEVVPDHLPDALKEGIRKFPEGTLQFEIGIQSFNPEVQSLISRKQNNQKAAENIRWLCTESHAHLHVDLIAGLPGETMESFGKGFDHLVAVGPHEIQFGILKRLRGTPIIRHTDEYALRFDPQPPYTILENRDIPFTDMQRLVRFARYWDMVANSGRFANTLPVMLGDAPFARFMAFSDWIFANTDATHRIALDRLAALVSQWLQQHDNMPAEEVKALLAGDYAGSAQHQQGASHKGQQAKEARANPHRNASASIWQPESPQPAPAGCFFPSSLCRSPHQAFPEARTFCRRPPDRCAELRIQAIFGPFRAILRHCGQHRLTTPENAVDKYVNKRHTFC
jgi:hypothetical protein